MFPPLKEEGRHVTAHPNVTMLLKLELVSTHFMVKASQLSHNTRKFRNTKILHKMVEQPDNCAIYFYPPCPHLVKLVTT